MILIYNYSMLHHKKITFIISCFIILFSCCTKPTGNGGGTTTPPPPPPVATNDVDLWLTYQSSLLQKQTDILSFGTVNNSFPFIDVDDAQTFQVFDDFGY